MKDELEQKGLHLHEQAICHKKWDPAGYKNPQFFQ